MGTSTQMAERVGQYQTEHDLKKMKSKDRSSVFGSLADALEKEENPGNKASYIMGYLGAIFGFDLFRRVRAARQKGALQGIKMFIDELEIQTAHVKIFRAQVEYWHDAMVSNAFWGYTKSAVKELADLSQLGYVQDIPTHGQTADRDDLISDVIFGQIAGKELKSSGRQFNFGELVDMYNQAYEIAQQKRYDPKKERWLSDDEMAKLTEEQRKELKSIFELDARKINEFGSSSTSAKKIEAFEQKPPRSMTSRELYCLGRWLFTGEKREELAPAGRWISVKEVDHQGISRTLPTAKEYQQVWEHLTGLKSQEHGGMYNPKDWTFKWMMFNFKGTSVLQGENGLQIGKRYSQPEAIDYWNRGLGKGVNMYIGAMHRESIQAIKDPATDEDKAKLKELEATKELLKLKEKEAGGKELTPEEQQRITELNQIVEGGIQNRKLRENEAEQLSREYTPHLFPNWNTMSEREQTFHIDHWTRYILNNYYSIDQARRAMRNQAGRPEDIEWEAEATGSD